MTKVVALSALLLSIFVQDSFCVTSFPRVPSKWEIRVNAALALIHSQPCFFIQKPRGCSEAAFIPRIPTTSMNVYTAEEGRTGGRLKAVVPDKKFRPLAKTHFHSAVIVIDPYPTASFGHLVFIFFVDTGVDRITCEQHGNYTVNRECITAARKKHCHNGVQRRKCDINFIPLVYARNDPTKSQKLQCNEQIPGFARCPTLANLKPRDCENQPKCPSPAVPSHCTYERCDHAVLISGGWNARTIHRRFGENLQRYHRFLLNNGFDKDNVVTFYAQRAGFEPSSADQRAKSYSVRNKFPVRSYISGICNSATCVDSLVIYLTGPASNSGALLFWDDDGDGLVQDGEIYTPSDLLMDLKYCGANRVFVVADHSYSGMLVEKLKSKAAHSHKKQFLKIAVLASSANGKAAWPGVFTDSFIANSKAVNRTKSVRSAFEDVKKDFRRRIASSTPSAYDISQGTIMDSTIYGGTKNVTWCEACNRMPPGSGCTLLKRSEWVHQQGGLRPS